jgi:ribosomal protein S18 acetylase RimI-like enzyme
MNIREALVTDARGIGRMQLASWQTMFPEAGIDAAEYLAQFTEDQREVRWRETILSDKPKFIFVAENDQQEIIGCLHGAPITPNEALPYASELIALHTLPGYRGQGLGKHLMRTFARTLHEQGLTSMMLWVIAGNRARQFYERQGGHYIREEPASTSKSGIEIAFTVVAYGWSDITGLL